MTKNEILSLYYGYDKLKPEQELVVDSILEGKDTIGILPTGFGKSVTFQIPALMLEGITIVITPLIALMQDQVNNLKKKKIKAAYINSLLSFEEQENIYTKVKSGKIKLLYVSAERLKSRQFIIAMKNVDVSLIVCDEAHTLLWSEDFRFALGEIPSYINSLPKRPRMLALTATATEVTKNKIITLLDLKKPNVISFDSDRKNLFYKVIKTTNKDRDLFFYINSKKEEQGIIYCLTIKMVNHVYSYLKEKGFKVGMFHGALDSIDKKRMVEMYSNKEILIMVATNAFGMGMDFPEIRYVIEYDIPASLEDFSQQVGRGSRDGKYAEGVLLFNLNDVKTIEYFIDNIEANNRSNKELKAIKEDRYEKLDTVVKLCLTNTCLHKYVSEYFGNKHPGKCGMCSNCVKSKYRF